MSLRITINGQSLSVEAGRTVLQAARENGIDIPTLCDFPGLTSHGSCRMCIVEIQGRPNTPSACTTPVEEGMIVQTDSAKVQALRTELFKLLLSEHPAACLFCEEQSHCDECMVTLRKTGVTTGCRSCPDDGQCELQVLAKRFDLSEGGYPVRYRFLPSEKKDPFFDRDYNLCVLCERCVRACEEYHFSSAITLTSRGTDTVVGTPFGMSLQQAGCTFCGACVEVCPTGTLSEKTRKWSGVPDGEVTTTCPLCSAGCQMRLLVKNGMVIGSLPDHANGNDVLCVKGRFGITEMVNHPSRLLQPATVDHEGSLPIPWEKAIEDAAAKISSCDPEKYGLVVSADCSNETLYIAQKFARDVVHSPSLYLSSASAYGQGLPVIERLYKASRPFSTLSTADTILCLGFDAKYAQSVVETELHHAKRNGAKLITFDTQNPSLRKFADEWLQPASGEEADLLEMLIENGYNGAATLQVQRAARLLKESKRPVILIGASFLTRADNTSLLELVEKLVAQIQAELILLPEKVNLGGALWLGITTPIPAANLEHLDVLHLVGESLPAELPSQPFVLYQNFCPPSTEISSGLILPAAAFTEENGTFMDHAGEKKGIHSAVQAPGSALPSWLILCRIAQKLGVAGFEFENDVQIRMEMESANRPEQVTGDWLDRPEPAVFPFSHVDDHGYMGFPLRNWVAGFKVLSPEPALNIER